ILLFKSLSFKTMFGSCFETISGHRSLLPTMNNSLQCLQYALRPGGSIADKHAAHTCLLFRIWLLTYKSIVHTCVPINPGAFDVVAFVDGSIRREHVLHNHEVERLVVQL